MKYVISGSIKFQPEYAMIIKYLSKQGNVILDYPKTADDLIEEYPEILKSFYTNIENCDVFVLFNKSSNGITGKVGASAFAELTYAIIQNTVHGKKIKIYLCQKPSKDVHGYDELMLWLKLGYIEVLNNDHDLAITALTT